MSSAPQGSGTAAAAESDFWRFSLDLYSRPGVARACLRLQDERGADVNVLLYLLHLARCRRRITPADMERIERLACDWRVRVVEPLRTVRRYLSQPPAPFGGAATAALRAGLKRIELESERLQQLALATHAPPASLGRPDADPAACARANLDLYAERMGGFPPEAVEDVLRRFGGE